MPNWCNNTVNISHEDPAMIERARKAFDEGGLLMEFFPTPKDLIDTVAGSVPEGAERDAHEAQMKRNLDLYGAKDWYDWNVANWGTKWDVGAEGGQPALVQDANSLTLNFDSAWAPPVGAYDRLQNLGFKILAYYHEPGMCFAGKWEDGSDDYYEIGGMTADQVAAELPDDLDECFAISESMAEYEAENAEEELTEWIKDGVEKRAELTTL